MKRSLVDKWCPEPHAAPITALSSDPASGALASADEDGTVAIFPPRSTTASLVLHHPAAVDRALAISAGGAHVAVGDDAGTLAVYRSSDGECIFVERRPGAEGEARAMRAIKFSPDGRLVACLAADGKIRITDLERNERIATYPDFSGYALDWDPSGVCLVAVDRLRQPILLQLSARQKVPFQFVPGGANLARFSPNGRHIILLGDGGLTLVDAVSLEIQSKRGADQNSGMLDLCFSPQGNHVAVVSARSVHYFQISGLRHVGRQRHGAPNATGVAMWDQIGVAVAARDSRLHRPDTPAPLPPTVCVSGQGAWRVVGHENHVALWNHDKRSKTFIPSIEVTRPGGPPEQRALSADELIVEARIDLEGSVLALLPEGGPVHVYDAVKGNLLFQAGEDTADTGRLEVGLGIVACLLPEQGIRWFDLARNRKYEMEWVVDFAVTGGGTWLAVLTPRGHVHVLDPITGADVMPPLLPIGDSPVRLMTFVHRRPELLVLDEDNVLALHNLAPAARDGEEVTHFSICAFYDATIDALWGLEDGKHAVVRIQDVEAGTATLVTVDLDTGEMVNEARDLLHYATVDPSHGVILQPAGGSAMIELDLDGQPVKLSRSLPGGQWVSFNDRRVISASPGAKRYLQEDSAP